jgi:hypothetical protein
VTRDEIIQAAREAVKSLRTDCIDEKPIDFDFGGDELYDERGSERWSYLEAMRCESCQEAILNFEDHGYVNDDGDPVELPKATSPQVDRDYLDEWAEEQGFEHCPSYGADARDLYAEGPMMNYMYPLGRSSDYSEDNARKLVDVPLCLVECDGAYLALTGGGMDLSWEICHAYILLGYLPPTHFTLPRMAGMHLTEKNAMIAAAVERASEIQVGWLERRRDDARDMFTYLEDNS